LFGSRDLIRFDIEHAFWIGLAQPVSNLVKEAVDGPEPFSSATMPVSHVQFVGLGLQEITKAEEGLAAFGFGRFQEGRSFFVRHDCFFVAGKTLS